MIFNTRVLASHFFELNKILLKFGILHDTHVSTVRLMSIDNVLGILRNLKTSVVVTNLRAHNQSVCLSLDTMNWFWLRIHRAWIVVIELSRVLILNCI